MDEWLEKWLADGKPIDLDLRAHLTPHRYGEKYQNFEDGARDFLALLRTVDRLSIFGLGWNSLGLRMWEDEEAFVQSEKERMQQSEYYEEDGSVSILDDGETRSSRDWTYYILKYEWGLYATSLSADFRRFHPDYSFTANDMIALVEAITRWKRPQHLEFGPSDYFHLHHPLDRARRGIRWIGWVPFALNASDVPEAALVQQMNGGTLIATQMDFWQCFEHHPLYSKEAIERAQEVEIRLNLLGVLPSAVELERGDWGVSSPRRE